MRAVVTGGIGGVVDTFGKSLKYATCFGEFTKLEHPTRDCRTAYYGDRSFCFNQFLMVIFRSILVPHDNVSSNDGLHNWDKFIFQ